MKTNFCLHLPLLLLLASFTFADERPNIVIILADDLGYGDTQPFNPDSKIATPNFNQLAKEGLMFTDAHSGSGVCTPTRYGLLCGRYAWRTRLKRGVLGGYSKPLVDVEQQTFAGQLQKAGYHTHVIGKWHLGLGWQWRDQEPDNINFFGIAGDANSVDYSKPLTDGPLDHGFSSCYLFPASLDMSPYVFIKDRQVEMAPTKVMDGKKFPDFYRKGETYEGFRVEDVLNLLTTKAEEYIAEQAKTESPFCLYFPLTAPHKPVSPSENFVGQTMLGPYGDFITEVDATVGRVMKALAANGVAENTLLIVTSDNGSFMYSRSDATDHVADKTKQQFHPDNHRANGPLRGTKADVFEAGHRVPYYVRWPNGMAKELVGTKDETTICHTDIMRTICALGKAEFDPVASPDSFDYSPILKGGSMDRPPVINHSANGTFAIRDGQWKLVLGSGSGGREKPSGKPFSKPYQLYKLDNDLAEKNSLLEAETDRVKAMKDAFWQIAGDDAEVPEQRTQKQN